MLTFLMVRLRLLTLFSAFFVLSTSFAWTQMPPTRNRGSMLVGHRNLQNYIIQRKSLGRFGSSGGGLSSPCGEKKRTLSFSTGLGMWSNDDEDIMGQDRVRACIPYMLPLLDGEVFGQYMYERLPIPLGFLDSLFVGPLYDIYKGVPFLGLLFFVALSLGTRGNTEMSRSVRFNAQQACLIDVALVVPELIGSCFDGQGLPRSLVEPCMNFVWYTYMTMVLYSVWSNLKGKKPDQIPWISGYAEMMVGPF